MAVAAQAGPALPSARRCVRVLFVSREPVFHARHGSSTAVRNLLDMLTRQGAQVDVLITCAASRSPRLSFRRVLNLPRGCTVQVPGYVRFGDWFVRPWSALAWMRAAARLLHRWPGGRVLAEALAWLCAGRLFVRSWDLTEPTAAERVLLQRAVRAIAPETVIANYAFWGIPLGQMTGVRRAILMHDLLSAHVEQFDQAKLRLDCNRISLRGELAWLDQADLLIAAQRSEAAAIAPRVSAEVFTQPMQIEAHAACATPEPLRCLFVGSDSPPNVQGLHWLLHEVWPLILRHAPEAVLAVAGSVCGPVQVPALPAGHVQMLGRLDSLDGEYARAAVCLVPLQVGSGIKIKLLEALSHGKAAVSTTVGVQGLEDWAEGVVKIADTPGSFAAAVLGLLRAPEHRRKREAAAEALVRERFAAGGKMERALLSRLFGPALPAGVVPGA